MSDQNYLFATENDFEHDQPLQSITTSKFLIFTSDNLLFGLDAESVVEIITNHTITELPMVPGYVEGIINLRGLIIPIVNMRLRLNKPVAENDCIIVLNVDGVRLGILVDGVYQMVDLDRTTISSVPAQNSQEMVSGMCSLSDGQTMLVLDCLQLLHI